MPLAAPHSVIALLALCCAWHSARAAQDYDNCTGFVDSLPATISTQGTWCLRRDLSTGLSSGAAITIAANNVTLDCNDFKLGGLTAGIATQTVGVLVLDRSNNTVRNCAVRGFLRGIRMTGSHHVAEDNRLEGNTATGILMTSAGSSLIRRNRIVDTGGTPHASSARAISTLGTVDILDNIIHGVLPTSGGGDGRSRMTAVPSAAIASVASAVHRRMASRWLPASV